MIDHKVKVIRTKDASELETLINDYLDALEKDFGDSFSVASIRFTSSGNEEFYTAMIFYKLP